MVKTNELIPINYDSDRPTVSARELHDVLNECKTFEQFFITVSKIKIVSNKEFLKALSDEVKHFTIKFNPEAVIYLADSVLAECCLPCNSTESKKGLSEKDYQKFIIAHFDTIFPELDAPQAEIKVNGIGRIDIFATHKETHRPVIIEIKKEAMSPNKQLIAYGSKFEDPILIAITDKEIPNDRRISKIIYIKYSEISKGQQYFINKFLNKKEK